MYAFGGVQKINMQKIRSMQKLHGSIKNVWKYLRRTIG